MLGSPTLVPLTPAGPWGCWSPALLPEPLRGSPRHQIFWRSTSPSLPPVRQNSSIRCVWLGPLYVPGTP